jgi:DNA-binding transcriptional regulator YiaG
MSCSKPLAVEHIRSVRQRLRTRRSKRPYVPSQLEFAVRFGLSVGALRDAEQGRGRPSKAMRVLLAAIELDPDLIEKAAVRASMYDEQEDTEIP